MTTHINETKVIIIKLCQSKSIWMKINYLSFVFFFSWWLNRNVMNERMSQCAPHNVLYCRSTTKFYDSSVVMEWIKETCIDQNNYVNFVWCLVWLRRKWHKQVSKRVFCTCKFTFFAAPSLMLSFYSANRYERQIVMLHLFHEKFFFFSSENAIKCQVPIFVFSV